MVASGSGYFLDKLISRVSLKNNLIQGIRNVLFRKRDDLFLFIFILEM